MKQFILMEVMSVVPIYTLSFLINSTFIDIKHNLIVVTINGWIFNFAFNYLDFLGFLIILLFRSSELKTCLALISSSRKKKKLRNKMTH